MLNRPRLSWSRAAVPRCVHLRELFSERQTAAGVPRCNDRSHGSALLRLRADGLTPGRPMPLSDRGLFADLPFLHIRVPHLPCAKLRCASVLHQCLQQRPFAASSRGAHTRQPVGHNSSRRKLPLACCPELSQSHTGFFILRCTGEPMVSRVPPLVIVRSADALTNNIATAHVFLDLSRGTARLLGIHILCELSTVGDLDHFHVLIRRI